MTNDLVSSSHYYPLFGIDRYIVGMGGKVNTHKHIKETLKMKKVESCKTK